MNFHVAILPSGTRFRSAFPGSGAYPCVQFGDGAIMPLPDWFLYPTAGFVRGQDCVAGVYQDRAALLWSSGAMEVYGVTLGPNSVFVDEDGIVSWVRSPDGAVILYSDDREPTPSRDTTHPRSRDANGRAEWNGIAVVPLGQSGPWEIGEEAKAPDGRTRILARLRGGAPQIAYDGYTPLPAHMQDFPGDVCVVAISLPEDEQTFFVESKDFTAYTPLEESPLSMPKFTPIGRPVCIVIDGGPGHRWFADTGRWKNEKLGVLCKLGEDDVKASAALAREKGIPFCPYTDTGNPKDTARQFAAMPVVPATPTLPIGQCYPIRGETNDDFAARARRIFGVLSELPTKHFGVYACAFLGIGTDGLRTKQQVIDGLAIVGNLAREFPKCRLIVAFALERGQNDGLAHQPELQTAFGWLQRASTAPDNYPTVEELRDAPQTPQRPTEPQKPTPVPTHAQLELPPYAQFVNVESREVFGAYASKHGHDPAVSDLFHFFWRRLVEGWSHAQILGDIRGEQQSVEFQAKLPWQPEYALFMSWAHRVQAEYHARHGRMPAETDMAHAAWRLLVERYSFSALLAGIGGTATAEVQGTPAVAQPTVLDFARSARLQWRVNFACHNDRHGVPVFDPFWSGLPEDRRREWAEDKLARGLTGILLSRKWGYQRYTNKTGFHGGELTHDEFVARCREAMSYGLYVLAWLPFDDDDEGQRAVYDGRMEADLRSLAPLAGQLAGVSFAWETPGAWRSKAICDAGTLSRRVLGPEAILILHGRDNERFTGSSFKGIAEVGETLPRGIAGRKFFDEQEKRERLYLTEDDDPSEGDEVGWWFKPGADQFDVFAWESRHGHDGPTYSDGNPDPDSGTWLGRFLEGLARFLPREQWNAKLRAVANNAPDWFHGPRAAGRPICCPFELQEYEDVLDVVDDARIAHVADLLKSYGVTTFGSGVPTSMVPK